MNQSISKVTAGKYKVVLEESWYHEKPEVREPDRHWYEQIPCKGGAFIRLYCDANLPCLLWTAGCPLRLPDCRSHGDMILKLWTPRPKNALLIWNQIKGHPSCYLDEMTGESDLFFPAALVHVVAELAGARRKRRLSPEARARLVERGTAALENYRNRNVEVEETAQH